MGERLANSVDNNKRTYTRRAVLATAAAYVAGLTYAAGKGAVELGKSVDKKLTSLPTPSTYTGLSEGDHLEWAEIYTTDGNGPANIRSAPRFTTDDGQGTKAGKAEVGTIMHDVTIVSGQGPTHIDYAQFDCDKASPPITDDKGKPKSFPDGEQCFVVDEFVRDASGN